MAKKHIVENFRVEVVPKTDFGDAATLEDCEKLRVEIRRHCDVESTIVKCEQREVCEFCGYPWELESDGKPTCCRKAVAEHVAAQQKAARKDS